MYCFALILLVLAMLPVNPTTTPTPFNLAHMKYADGAIEDAIAQRKTPGAVLLVGCGDNVVYLKAYGNRAVEPQKVPMTTDTVFDLASMTKPMATATSILILAERGKLDLHAPVAKYIPEFGQNGKDTITVEQLLLHRGGLIADNPMKDYEDGPQLAMQRIWELKPRSEPGTKFVYTDVGPIVLGELVHRVSGKRLDEFARDEIFKPLGMSQTSFAPLDEDRLKRCAPTEKRNGRFMLGEVHDPRSYALGGVAGHAGLFGTAEDASKWCRMLINGGELDGKRVLSANTIAEMTKMRCLPDGTGCRGYGVDIDSSFSSCRGQRFARGTTFGHTGYTGTMFWIDPVNKVYFILLTNRVHPDGKGDVKELRSKVATVVAEALLGPDD
jgi:CubicO group peptidase (beta-lactamase class C family)